MRGVAMTPSLRVLEGVQEETDVSDTTWMARALALAERAEGRVSPRPPVGAVIVDSAGLVVGEGWTQPTPGPHAEVMALEAAGRRARGATAYVTLEPCAHTAATGPCAEALVRAGVARVVAGLRDPYSLVRGRGFAILRRAGIDVRVGVLGRRAREFHEPFGVWATVGRPLVTLKLAASLDGKVAAPDGTSRWITGQAARREVHELRRRVDAVLVGAGTVEADDPELTVRLVESDRQPVRVVVDSSGRTSPRARVFDGQAPVWILTTDRAPAGRRQAWASAGAEVAVLPRAENGVDLTAGLEELGRRGLCHVLAEPGPRLASSLAEAGLVDRFLLYLAPKVIGGDAPGLFAEGVKTLADAWGLRLERVTRVDDDLRVQARVRR